MRLPVIVCRFLSFSADTSCSAAPTALQFNAEALAMLEGMGFPTIRCQKALLATGNSNADAAMEWLFGHMEDPGA